MQSRADVVVAWYSEELYPDVLATMEDAPLLPPTYASWQRGFEEQVQKYISQGARVVAHLVEPHAFSQWCREQGLRPNAQARLEYLERVAQRH